MSRRIPPAECTEHPWWFIAEPARDRSAEPPHLLYREQPDDRAGDVATVEAGEQNDRARPK